MSRQLIARLLQIHAELGIPRELIVSRGLSPFDEAESLVLAEVGEDGREHFLSPSAASAWHALRSAASRDGVSLSIISAFRSIERQAEIIRRKLSKGASIEEILGASAPPGYSQHHTGRAIDVSTPGSRALEIEFDKTEAYSWLLANARQFEFSLPYPLHNNLGYQYEPWHWCYRDA